ncbi:MAG: TRAP transporter small permease subunit [Deltaproteobacteria bacterium]|nr:TRAP transporter small permease subunit [Deltaproteobacteria bacterium]
MANYDTVSGERWGLGAEKGGLAIRTLINIIDTISEWTGRFAVWALVVVVGIIVYEVITRRVFGSPHVWTYEIITFFYGFHFMILAAYTLLHKGHVAIDIIYIRFSPKKQAVLDLVTYLFFFFPFVIILLYVGFDNAVASWATGEKTLTARLPLVLPGMKTVTPIAALLLLLQGFSIFYRRLFFLTKGREL